MVPTEKTTKEKTYKGRKSQDDAQGDNIEFQSPLSCQRSPFEEVIDFDLKQMCY